MYQINCRILDGKNSQMDDRSGPYMRILSSEHSSEITNPDHANKMDALTDGEHAHAQKHISVTKVTIGPRGSSSSGQPYTPPAGQGTPLLQLDRPGDAELDVVQTARSTIVIPRSSKSTLCQVPANQNPVCGQTERSARPVFLEKLKSQTVEEGQCTRFTCQVKGQPMPSVQWEKDGRKVAGEKFKLINSGETFTLELAETTVADAGRYVSIATNEVGEARSMASLMVQKGQGHGSKVGQVDFRSALQNRTQLKTYNLQSMNEVCRSDFRSVLNKQHSDVRTKPSATFRQLEYSGVEGATVSMSCHIVGYPDPKIAWFKNMQLVEPSESVRFTCLEGVSTLELSPVEAASGGTYSCHVENELGKSSSTCRLSIRGASCGVESTKVHAYQDLTYVNNISDNNGLQDDGKISPTKTTENRVLSSDDNAQGGNHSPRVAKMLNGPTEDTGKEGEEISSLGGRGNAPKLVTYLETKESEVSPEKPSSNSQSEENPSTDSLSTSGKTPSTDSQSTSGKKPSTNSQSLSWRNPSTDSQPTSGKNPSTDSQPRSWKNPSTDSQPTSGKNPSPDSQPRSWKNPSTASQPTSGKDPSTDSQPRSWKNPSTDSQPTSGKIPSTDSQSMTGNNPLNSSLSTAGIKPSTDSQQTSLKVPSTNSQPEFSGTGKTDSSTAQVGSFAIEDEDDDAFEPVSNDAVSSTVDEPPFIEDLQPENLHVLCGSEILLVARFSGHPLPQTKWLKGSELLTQDDRIRFETKPRFAELTILNAQPQDTGTYTIVITNEFGEDKQLSSVTVEDIPDPPVGRPAVTSILDSSVVLSWSGSSYDGGCPVVRYRIEISHQQADRWEVLTDDCQHTTYQVNNLVANTEYVFRVSAANKHGFSRPGDVSDSIVTNGLKVSSAASSAASDDFPFAPRVVTIGKDRKFADTYVLGEEIGKGKFGSVYKCTEKTTDRLFAAKFIRVKTGQRDEFRQEIGIMNELHHPKLLLLWDAFESAKEIILVMEHVSGGELMERIINDDYVLTERECIHFMRQICDGIQYMHSSDILHLDLKPENILCITPNSNEIKIIDFGLARKFDPAKEFKIMFGTAEFVAPEVINYDAISYKTDMWSVGVICYVLLSGLSPFLGNNDKETLVNVTKAQFDFDDDAFDEISDDAKDFISKLLVKDQRKRMWVEDSLRHCWMAQDVTYMRAKKLSTVKHKKFMARNKWQKTGHALVALRRMVGLQRMSSGLMDSCRSPLSSSSQCESPSLLSDSMSTISESDDSGFRSAQTNSIDLKSILGISKDLDGVTDPKVVEVGGRCESMKDETAAGCEGKLLQENKNDGSILDDRAPVRESSSECSDKSELSDTDKSLVAETSEGSGLESEFGSGKASLSNVPAGISLEAKISESSNKSEGELSCATIASEGEKCDASIEKSDIAPCATSEMQDSEEMLTVSSPRSESTPTSATESCSLQENVSDSVTERSLTKPSDQKTSICTKNSDHSKVARRSSDQPSEITKKRELFAKKSNDLPPPVRRNTESPSKKSLDQHTVSRFSDKSKAARTCSDQPSQTTAGSRNVGSAVAQGKLSNKPSDFKPPAKSSESASITRKSPAASFSPTTKTSDSLVSARKLAVQQLSSQKTAKPKKAPTFVRKMKNLKVLEGAAAKFDILADGNPLPTISWFKDGKEIPVALEKYRTESSDEGRCSLTVMNCGEHDDAEYGCKATNSLGAVMTKANLYVDPVGEELDNHNGAGCNQMYVTYSTSSLPMSETDRSLAVLKELTVEPRVQNSISDPNYDTLSQTFLASGIRYLKQHEDKT